MAIVVLVLWMFTAGAGFYLLVTSNLGHARPASAFAVAGQASAGQVSAGQASASQRVTASVATRPAQTAAASPEQSVSDPALDATAPEAAASEAAASEAAAPGAAASGAAAPGAAAPTAAAASTAATAPTQQAASDVPLPPALPPVSKREARRAVRNRFDPPSLTAAKAAPVVPGLRSLLEFAHPACATVGLGFWLGYTFIHYRALGWIAFGLVTVTVGLGLSWFAANTRAARHRDAANHDDAAGRRSDEEPRPSFSTRLVALHGGAAAVTFALAALTVLVLR